jgi:outer membrane protein TolC
LDLLKQKIEMFDEALLLVNLMKENYEDELAKFKLGNSTQTDIIVVLEDYFNALKSLNSLKYDVWKSYVEIKFLLGDLPKNEEELNNFLLLGLFYQI